MAKSIYRPENKILAVLIREARKRADITQEACSAALGHGQSFMSDVENGSRRLDLIQLRDLCQVLNTDLVQLVKDFERKLKK